MFTLCEMTARNVILERWVEDEREEKNFPAWKEVWDFCFEKKNGMGLKQMGREMAPGLPQ